MARRWAIRGEPARTALAALLLVSAGTAAGPARPDGLDEEERATIALFEAAQRSVVYISTAERVLDLWTRNVHDMPRGTGSGFLWDRDGHVVTNNHVIAGASAAVVRLADGSAHPPSLGVQVDPQIDALAARRGFEGVLVLGVEPGSGAEQAGLRPARLTRDGRIVPGDAIVGLDGMAVEDVDDLLAALEMHAAGEAVEVKVVRDGERITLEAEFDPGT